jgi:hypothetical protein
MQNLTTQTKTGTKALKRIACTSVRQSAWFKVSLPTATTGLQNPNVWNEKHPVKLHFCVDSGQVLSKI